MVKEYLLIFIIWVTVWGWVTHKSKLERVSKQPPKLYLCKLYVYIVISIFFEVIRIGHVTQILFTNVRLSNSEESFVMD